MYSKNKQENIDFDSMVANILSEHKDEIQRNVEQQGKLISKRMQLHQLVTEIH